MQFLLISRLLLLLNNSKISPNNLAFSSLVPIPPSVWNGAIDVMKIILRATKSTQRAIRVAATYIIDRGGTEAQAEEFRSAMTLNMVNTKWGKLATLADTDDSLSTVDLLTFSANLQLKIDTSCLNTMQKVFVGIDLQSLTKKELIRYVEIVAGLLIDPAGVLMQNIVFFLDEIEKSLKSQPNNLGAETSFNSYDFKSQANLFDDELEKVVHTDDAFHEVEVPISNRISHTYNKETRKQISHMEHQKNRKDNCLTRRTIGRLKKNFERICLRIIIIAVLVSLVTGFKVYDYYSIAKFAVVFGLTLLFWLECKGRFYWTMLITAFGICLFNPFDKLHFSKSTWIMFDKCLIGLLIISVFFEVLLIVISLRRYNPSL